MFVNQNKSRGTRAIRNRFNAYLKAHIHPIKVIAKMSCPIPRQIIFPVLSPALDVLPYRIPATIVPTPGKNKIQK